MSKPSPLVALLTDFGLRDQYAALIKGTMLSICPNLRIVDITHDVETQNIQQAAYLLWSSYRHFPSSSIFACIVDPGVGTSRDIIGAMTKRHIFLAPDNGLLDIVLWQENVSEVTVVQIGSPTLRSLLPADISNTFHGRDIFAPLSAHLSKGVSLKSLGSKRRVDWLQPPFVDQSHPRNQPKILHIDRFGNIITNIVGLKNGPPMGMLGIQLGRTKISMWIENYESAPSNAPCLIVGSSGLIEIVIKNKSAAAALKVNHTVPMIVLRK
ncbi:MAG: SAM-dependent chlorinase/fluorinase [Ignavibacteria bacterium]|nr:SAM-dependent chlorinase/fluorinase [Ignavibacteria bacterium]